MQDQGGFVTDVDALTGAVGVPVVPFTGATLRYHECHIFSVSGMIAGSSRARQIHWIYTGNALFYAL